MSALLGMMIGFALYLTVRYFIFGFFTVNQNERAIKTSFGKAQRVPGRSISLDNDAPERYDYPALEVIPPGGPYFKLPWEKVYKVNVATGTISMAYDPETPSANSNGKILEAVTKDQLNTGLTGQIRYRVSERNLYAYLFGVKTPLTHVMGYFISVLRERIANYEAKGLEIEGVVSSEVSEAGGISINDLRKNLQDLNDHMLQECHLSEARYGVVLDASLITGIDPPGDVESALAAINTAHNQISSDVSLARAEADQTLEQSKRAVEIETLHAQAEVEPLEAMADQLAALKGRGPRVLKTYLRNVRLSLYRQAERLFIEVGS